MSDASPSSSTASATIQPSLVASGGAMSASKDAAALVKFIARLLGRQAAQEWLQKATSTHTLNKDHI